MLRPNLVMDAPPTEISVGGVSYPAQTDFRIWLQVMELFSELNLHPKSEATAQDTLDKMAQIQTLVFGGVLVEEQTEEVMKALAEFSKGYPSAPIKSSGGEQTYSFEYDLNAIIIAIRNQSGIDLSYRRKEPFHWWEFLIEFQTLCGNHYILNLMEARGYKGTDKELIRRRNDCALPLKMTPEEQEEYDEFSAQFDTGDDYDEN